MAVAADGVAERASGHRRQDIQGLRAVAVLLVAAFHAGLPLWSGFVGVDVFFVISGFVITTMLLREHMATGRVRMGQFYARRVKRLLPALVVMVTVTVAMSAFLQSPLRSPFPHQEITARTGVAAVVSAGNYEIYDRTGGYFDPSAESNPLLHTWSLSVEEQFYLVLPMVLALALRWRVRRRGSGPQAVWPAALVLGAIGLASFGLAFLLTHALIGRNRSLLAFYASPTRAWEFIAGALLALGVPALVRMTSKRSGSWSTLFAVLAVPMLVASAVGFRGRVMAGPVGLLPVSATCLALAAGAVSAGGLSRLLAWRPLVWIGDRSYSIYLWHWPFIVYAVSLWGRRWPVMTAAALVSIVPAALSFRFVEEPIRRASFRPWQVVRLASACAAVPILASAGLLVATRASWGMDFIQDLTDRNGAFQSDIAGCQRIGDATYKCDHVSTGARGSVFLVGDSHAISLSPAVTAAGLALHLDVSVRAKGGCSFSDLPGDQASDCQSWARSIVREIAVARPDVVVIHQCARVGAGCPASGQSWLPTWRDGLNRIVRAIRPSTGAVLVVGDVPGFEKDIASCVTVLRPLRTGSSCGQRDLLDWDRDNAPVVAAERAATEDLAGVTHVDPTPAVCGRSVCEQVRDGVAMYFDSHHLTLRGAAQLTPLLQAELAQAAGGLPTR